MESKVYTKEETSQTGIRLHSSQPALLIHRAVCGNIGGHQKNAALDKLLVKPNQGPDILLFVIVKPVSLLLEEPQAKSVLIVLFISGFDSNEKQQPSDLTKPSPQTS